MKTVLAAACGFLCLLRVTSAEADITFCNHYSSQVWVAIGLYNVNDTLGCYTNYNEDEMTGWYNIQPGNCSTVFGGCFGGADWVEFFANAADGAYWAGQDDYGSLSYSAFDFCYDTSVCYGSCPSFNFGPVGFRFIQMSDCGFLQMGFSETINLN